MSNKAYDVAKYIAMIGLPALITFYASVAAVWALPHTEEVVVTMAAVNTFLGTLLGLSTHKYNKINTHKGDPK